MLYWMCMSFRFDKSLFWTKIEFEMDSMETYPDQHNSISALRGMFWSARLRFSDAQFD